MVSQPPDTVERLADEHRGQLGITPPAGHTLEVERTDDTGLLSYNVSRAPQLSNPMDPASATTGSTSFVLTEVYETEAGVADHFQKASDSWQELPALAEWLEKCEVTAVPAAPIINSLW